MRLRTRHYWRRYARRRRPERFGRATCDPEGTTGKLSTEPQAALSWFGRAVAFLTTPFKFLGISGWKETGCDADAVGRPVRDAQHSTDGFWTIDVRLEAFRIATTSADPRPDKFIRIEVEPGTKAHRVCAATRVLKDIELAFRGAVVVDTDGPFLEVHPEDDFRVLMARGGTAP
ncbi:MAG: hypothetical protein ACRD1P_02920 [Thermoanaerobaculia bacterium]